jgi:hypothetical protein
MKKASKSSASPQKQPTAKLSVGYKGMNGGSVTTKVKGVVEKFPSKSSNKPAKKK